MATSDKSIAATAVREQIAVLVSAMEGHDRTMAALGYGLSHAVHDRLEQLEGVPRGYGRKNRRDRLKALRAALDNLVELAGKLEYSDEEVLEQPAAAQGPEE